GWQRSAVCRSHSQSWNSKATQSANVSTSVEGDRSARGKKVHRNLSGRQLFSFVYHQLPAFAGRTRSIFAGADQWAICIADRSGADVRVPTRGGSFAAAGLDSRGIH